MLQLAERPGWTGQHSFCYKALDLGMGGTSPLQRTSNIYHMRLVGGCAAAAAAGFGSRPGLGVVLVLLVSFLRHHTLLCVPWGRVVL